MKKEETVIQGKIVRALEKHGLVLRMQVGAYRSIDGKRIVKIGKKGMPDLMYLSMTGEVAFIEVKTPTGKLSSEQVDMIHTLGRMGFRVGVAKTVEEALTIAGILHI